MDPEHSAKFQEKTILSFQEKFQTKIQMKDWQGSLTQIHRNLLLQVLLWNVLGILANMKLCFDKPNKHKKIILCQFLIPVKSFYLLRTNYDFEDILIQCLHYFHEILTIDPIKPEQLEFLIKINHYITYLISFSCYIANTYNQP